MNPHELTFDELDQYLLGHPPSHLIHQIWFTIRGIRIGSNKSLLKSCSQSWDLENPMMYHLVWNRKHCVSLIRKHYAEFEGLFFALPHEIQRCDFARYCILHRYGGIYADMDYKCTKPFEQVWALWNSHDVYLVQSPHSPGDQKYVSNSLMIARIRGHDFWRVLMSEILQASNRMQWLSRHFEVMYTTGPAMLTRVFNIYRFRYKLHYLPAELFHPLSLYKRELSTEDRRKVYAIHYGLGSWEKIDSKVLIELWRNYAILLICMGLLVLPQMWCTNQ